VMIQEDMRLGIGTNPVESRWHLSVCMGRIRRRRIGRRWDTLGLVGRDWVRCCCMRFSYVLHRYVCASYHWWNIDSVHYPYSWALCRPPRGRRRRFDPPNDQEFRHLRRSSFDHHALCSASLSSHRDLRLRCCNCNGCWCEYVFLGKSIITNPRE
jgi:hypothetical protein